MWTKLNSDLTSGTLGDGLVDIRGSNFARGLCRKLLVGDPRGIYCQIIQTMFVNFSLGATCHMIFSED